MSHHQYFEDPETGEVYELITESEHRNAGPRDHRSSGGQRPRIRPIGDRPPTRSGGIRPRDMSQPPVVRRHSGNAHRTVPAHRSEPVPVQEHGDYVRIRKSALAEILPAAGQLWASFLVRPEMPRTVGDDIIDRDNATMHRDALALHQQNQTRVLALTQLASRALRILLE